MSEINRIIEGKFDDHILPFFWLHGADEQVLIDYMEKIYQSNIRSVCMESRPHPEFLKDGWWKDLDIVMREAKRLGMKVWILDDSHFPTGYANGLVKKKYPERLKRLLSHKRVEVVGESRSIGVSITIFNDATARVLSVYAKQGNQVIDLSKDKEQTIIYFDVPKGIWQVYIIYETSKVEYNPDYINMVDKESCKVLLEAVYEPHYQRYQNEFGKTIAGFFSDEPGFMNEKGLKNDSAIGKATMPLPWSEEVENNLRQRLGNNFMLQLSSLWYQEDNSAFVRHEFMDICTQLYQENFSEQLGNWCRDRNVEYIGHVIEDRDSNARLGVGAGHMFRAMHGQDMAGLDIVLNQLIPGIDTGIHPTFRGTWDSEFFHYALVKLGTSLGHIDPKKKGRTMAEVFGAFGWSEGLKMMKWITDHFIVRGTNYFVPHAFSEKEFPDVDCPPHFYAHGNHPQFRYFKDLMLYMNQLSTLFSDGITKPKVSVLYHAEAEWSGSYMLSQKVTKELTRHQIDFDIIPNDVFADLEKYNSYFDGELHVNTQNYQSLFIPYSECISLELAKFIVQSSETRFKVVFIDDYPTTIYNGDNQILKGIKQYAEVINLEGIFDYVVNQQLFTIRTSSNQPYLRYHHYYKNNLEYMMLFNEDPKHMIETRIMYETKQPIYQFDVLLHQLAKVENHKGFDITLHPYQSYVYVIGNIDEGLMNYDMLQYNQEIVLNGKYQLSIANSFDYPNFQYQKELSQLENMSLIKHFPNFSGTFRYEIDFDLETSIHQAMIELGDVYEIAELYINGKNVGSRFAPPYQFEVVNMLQKGKNKIVVDVTNTLDKQVMDVISQGEEIKPSGLLDFIKIKY